MALPSLCFSINIRQSNDHFSPYLWFVYQTTQGSETQALLMEATSKADAQAKALILKTAAVNAYLAAIDPAITISEADFTALHTELQQKGFANAPLSAVTELALANKLSLSSLTPLKGKIPPFHKAVPQLTRPYIAISDSEQAELERAKYDYYLTPGGAVVSFGNASCNGTNTTYALMPFKNEHADKIKADHDAKSSRRLRA